jgi:hypothetical protein
MFNLHGKPPKFLPKNAACVVGDVFQTLPHFNKSLTSEIHFVHFDLDIYAATNFVLRQIKPYLSKNALLLFDDFHGNPNWRSGEFLALKENLNDSEYEYVAFGPNQALIKLVMS